MVLRKPGKHNILASSSFRAAKTLQKATANGGNGGDGVVGRRLLAGEDGFPDSFIVVGAVAETLNDHTQTPLPCTR